jgi:4-aminobutyrate aminotransferase/(S)-3-amino-2-methylpropionate transaminase
MADTYEIIGDIRGIGLMVGVELVKDKKLKTPATQARNQILSDCHKKGLLIIGAGVYKNVIRFLPPLSISKTLLEEGLDIFEESLKKSHKGSQK